jgi:hypothetical protein
MRNWTANGGYGWMVRYGCMARRLTQRRPRSLHHRLVGGQKPEPARETVRVVGAVLYGPARRCRCSGPTATRSRGRQAAAEPCRRRQDRRHQIDERDQDWRSASMVSEISGPRPPRPSPKCQQPSRSWAATPTSTTSCRRLTPIRTTLRLRSRHVRNAGVVRVEWPVYRQGVA